MASLKNYHRIHNLGTKRCGDTAEGRKVLKLPQGYLVLPAYVSVSDDKDSLSFVYTRTPEPRLRLSCTTNESSTLYETYLRLLKRMVDEGIVLQRYAFSARGMKRAGENPRFPTPVGVFARVVRSGVEVSYMAPDRTGQTEWLYSGHTTDEDKVRELIVTAETKRQLAMLKFEQENRLPFMEAAKLHKRKPSGPRKNYETGSHMWTNPVKTMEQACLN